MSDVKAARRAAKVRKVAALAACPKCGADKSSPCVDTTGNHRERVTAAGKVNQAHREQFSDRHDDPLGERDHYGRQHQSAGGPGAAYGGDCDRCGNPMREARGMVQTSRGWIHRACAPGANDE